MGRIGGESNVLVVLEVCEEVCEAISWDWAAMVVEETTPMRSMLRK